MAYKMKTSPMYQTYGVAGVADAQGQITPGNTQQSTPTQPVAVPTVQNQLSIAPEPTAVNKYKSEIKPAQPTTINPGWKPTTSRTAARMDSLGLRNMQETSINPKAFTNMRNVRGLYGDYKAGGFTRTVQSNEAPIMQLANPGMLQDGPELPPQGVQTSVTPTLGFENS